MSISHRQARTFIDQALDSPLDQTQLDTLNSHLSRCNKCQKYANDQAQFNRELSSSLSKRWPLTRSNQVAIENTTKLAQNARSKKSYRRPFENLFSVGMNLAVGAALLFIIFWLFRPETIQNQEVSETAGINQTAPLFPAVKSEQASYSGESKLIENEEITPISVEIDWFYNGTPGPEIDLIQPDCGDRNDYPLVDDVADSIAQGVALTDCQLIKRHTLSFSPGESREILLVVRNPTSNDLLFSIVDSQNGNSQTNKASVYCGEDIGATSTNEWDNPTSQSTECQPFQVPARGLWAKFITIYTPNSIAPGAEAKITLSAIHAFNPEDR